MRHQIFPVVMAILALAVSFSAWADFTGKVVNVAEGDSLTVLRDRVPIKVRLVEITVNDHRNPSSLIT